MEPRTRPLVRPLIVAAAALAVLAAAFLVITALVTTGATRILGSKGGVTVYAEGQNGPIVVVSHNIPTGRYGSSLSSFSLLQVADQVAGPSAKYVYARTIDGWPAVAFTTPIPYGDYLTERAAGVPLTLVGPGRLVHVFWVDDAGSFLAADVYIPDSSTATISSAVKPLVSFPGVDTFPSRPLTTSKPVFKGLLGLGMGQTFFPLSWHEVKGLPQDITWPGATDASTWEGPGGTWIAFAAIPLAGKAPLQVANDTEHTFSYVQAPLVPGWRSLDLPYTWNVAAGVDFGETFTATDVAIYARGPDVIEAAALDPFDSSSKLLAVAVQGPRKDFVDPKRAPWKIPLTWLYPTLGGAGLWQSGGQVF